ncbi:oligosaccharide flippase family protein [Shewanella putrefaciens]|uniref:Polysaccharide biosynthesis protein n=1 Tax=Shewanella putrefaciens (strain CN-32 / ATCC BAA-453) TaxID=319224 RepID=A4Y8H3_SHEPC|nr:oligosaccharide flippase family protein [Shewanella putrefaciens]QGS49347.1 oligosaccharide flippase family protein [Shewanella putrefaciens]
MKKLNNLSYGILNTIQNAIFPLVTLPYVLQTLGPELYGKNLHAALFHLLFTFLFVLAINPYALRLFSHAMQNGDIVEANAFSRLVSFQFIMSSVATALQLAVISILDLCTPLYLLYTVITFFAFMNVEWLFQAKQDYKTIFFRTFLIRTFILFALFSFINGVNDFFKYSVIMASSSILPAVVSYLIARRYYTFSFKYSNFKEDFVGAKYFFMNGGIGSVYSYLDQVVIGLFVTNKELAILNLIKTLASTIMSIPNVVNRFIMPDAFRAVATNNLSKHHKKYFSLMILCLVVGLSIFYLYGLPIISMFLGDKIDFNQFYLLLISISVLCTSIAVYIDTQSSVILELEKITTLSNSMVAILSPVFAVILFEKLNFLSPFIGFTIGEFVGVLVMIYMHIFIFKTGFVRKSMS